MRYFARHEIKWRFTPYICGHFGFAADAAPDAPTAGYTYPAYRHGPAIMALRYTPVYELYVQTTQHR